MHVWMYGCMEAQPKIQIPKTQASIYLEGTTPPRSPHVARAAEEEAGAGFGGSYPTSFLGRLLFKITDPNHKTRYPKKGVGYEPLGRIQDQRLGRVQGLWIGVWGLGPSNSTDAYHPSIRVPTQRHTPPFSSRRKSSLQASSKWLRVWRPQYAPEPTLRQKQAS